MTKLVRSLIACAVGLVFIQTQMTFAEEHPMVRMLITQVMKRQDKQKLSDHTWQLVLNDSATDHSRAATITITSRGKKTSLHIKMPLDVEIPAGKSGEAQKILKCQLQLFDSDLSGEAAIKAHCPRTRLTPLIREVLKKVQREPTYYYAAVIGLYLELRVQEDATKVSRDML